jgi:ketosteroid isomerase-like protein
MSTTADIAADFAALCKAGELDAAGEKYWSPDVVSIEAGGPPGKDPAARGIDAVRAKGEWWYGAHDVHSVETSGPYVHGDQFILRFAMDITEKASGNRIQMEEEALYTVKDGKVVEERFFY